MIELLLDAERAMSLGRTDQAERLFRQAADADPRNSIAVVGLARVALEHEDEAGALALARRALEIDADNPAAQRLADRLVEVMAYRGEAPQADAPAASDAPEAPPADAAATTEAPTKPERRGLLRRFLRR
jgi:tetratricopeptide (TPR) repeat protein